MFCSRCGSEIAGSSKFCPSCGLDLMATTPVHALATGQIAEIDLVREALSAEYEIVEELGRGGMALVFRARDRSLEREVAIKVLPFSLAFDAEFVERFQREARTAAQLEHPNIIPIYRVGRAGRVIYFVMKYLRGGALSNVLGERGRLTPPEIRRLLIESGGALGYAAQRGIVHRDIKPDNIMFDEFGHSVLTDFGIAKAASGQKLTGTGMSIGTPHYMSPEQARAQTIDGRSDIYSLGVVAYQCLTGIVPYDGEDSFAIGYKHITEPVPTPTLVSSDERRLFEVIRQMLMKDPQDRFQTCEELVAAMKGQPTAPAGAIRARSGAGSSAPAAPAAPPAPALANQPTTPLSSAAVDRRQMPADRRAAPRRVADRSAAMKSSGNSRAWLWLLLTIGGAAAGMLYYYKAHGFASTGGGLSAVPGDSVGAARPDSGDSLRHEGTAASADTTGSALPPALVTDTPTARPAERVSTVPLRGGSSLPLATLPGAATPSGDSGTVRVVGNFPGRTTVYLDGTPAASAVTRLPVGRHEVAVSAPFFDFWVDTIDVANGQETTVRPALTRVTAPLAQLRRDRQQERAREAQSSPVAAACEPGAGFNVNHVCFDERAKPTTPTFVPRPAGDSSTPRPSVLWVRVAADGHSTAVRPFVPSNDPEFERAARAFAMNVSWRPALKNGQPVTAWTQWIFQPR